MSRAVFALLLLLPAAPAQERDPALAAKLASPFLKRAPWLLDFERARAEASKRGRLVFGYFTTTGP